MFLRPPTARSLLACLLLAGSPVLATSKLTNSTECLICLVSGPDSGAFARPGGGCVFRDAPEAAAEGETSLETKSGGSPEPIALRPLGWAKPRRIFLEPGGSVTSQRRIQRMASEGCEGGRLMAGRHPHVCDHHS